jgi:hypothetical protein
MVCSLAREAFINYQKYLKNMARNIIISVFIAGGLIAAASTVSAGPEHQAMVLNTPGVQGKVLHLPAAADNADVISLGTAFDVQSGKVVEGYAVFHHKDGHGGGPGGGGDPEPDPSPTCYAFLANGAGWTATEDYLVDPTNVEGISSSTVSDLVASGLAAWDDEVATNIFGDEVAGVVDGMDTNSTDGKNEFMFGDIAEDGVVGVTIVWGVFRGKPSERGLVEWDMMLDQADYDWSTEALGVVGKMDFANVFNHEAGHALGLGHPADSCTDETMYRFVAEEETKKRDLNAGDIEGVNALY